MQESLKAWLRQGEWVQTYTRRGSPRLPPNGRAWKTNRERLEEWACGVLLIAAPVVGFLVYAHWTM